MKSILRTVVYAYISIKSAEYVVDALLYGFEPTRVFLLFLLALALLFFFLKPLVKLVGLPSEGLGYTFLLFAMTALLIYILTLFLPGFSVQSTTLAGLNVLGFDLPAKSLTPLWAIVFTALVMSLVYKFFDWLNSKK